MDEMNMSRDLTLIEKMGVEFEVRNGLFYPLVDGSVGNAKTKDIGKYGHLWILYMKENHKDRYRYHVRMGQLCSKANEVNEEAYEMLEGMMNQYLKNHVPEDRHSTMKVWELRKQAKSSAEEVVYEFIVYQYR